MSFPSVTYTFVNGTAADATQVNTNFTDLINGLSDGSKDLNINALTMAGNLTVNGNIALGNLATDTLTITATILGNLIATDNTYDIGADGATRFRNLFLAGNSKVSGLTLFTPGATAATPGLASIIETTQGFYRPAAGYLNYVFNAASVGGFQIENRSANGGAQLNIFSADAATGDQSLSFGNASTTKWSFGRDTSASALVISFNGTLGTSNALSIADTTLAATFLGQLIGKGTATNDSASAGQIGESIVQSRVRSADSSLTTGTTLNVTAASLDLTKGDWIVGAMVGFEPSATTNVSRLNVGISLTSATLPANDTIAVPTAGEVRVIKSISGGTVIGADYTVEIPTYRISLAADTSFYLVAQANFTIDTLKAYGSIFARRVR